MKEISDELYAKLEYLGIIDNEVRSHNIGKSNYSKKTIQPWAVWLDYPELTGWDDDIIKRVLRVKEETGMSENQARKMDYEKIIHNCQERMRQIDIEERILHNDSSDVYHRQVLCIKTWIMDGGVTLIESFTENFYYNQPCENVVIDNLGVKITVSNENFNKYFKK